MQLATALTLLATIQLAIESDEDVLVDELVGVSLDGPVEHIVHATRAAGGVHVAGGHTRAPGVFGSEDRAFVVAHDASAVPLWAWHDALVGSRTDDVFVSQESNSVFAAVAYLGVFTSFGQNKYASVRRHSATGAISWETEIAQDVETKYAVRLTGSVDGSRLFASANDDDLETSTTLNRGLIYSLDPLDGSIRWEFLLGDTRYTHSLCTDGSGARLFASTPSSVQSTSPRVLALDGDNGSEMWNVPLAPMQVDSVGLVHCDDSGQLVYAVGVSPHPSSVLTSRLLALDGARGTGLWALDLPGEVFELHLDPSGDRILLAYETNGFHDVYAAAVDASDGTFIWNTLLEPDLGVQADVFAFPDWATNRLIIATEGTEFFFEPPPPTKLHAVGIDTGEVLNVEVLPVEGEFNSFELSGWELVESAPTSSGVLTRIAFTDANQGTLELRTFGLPGLVPESVGGSELSTVVPEVLELAGRADGSVCYAMGLGDARLRVVTAVEVATGATLWQAELPGATLQPIHQWRGRMLVSNLDGSRVLAARRGYKESRSVDALDAGTGEVLWSRDLDEGNDLEVLELAEPTGTFEEAVVLLMIEEEDGDSPNGLDTLRALTATTGINKWKKSIPSEWNAEGWESGSLAVSEDESRVFALYATGAGISGTDLLVVAREVLDGSLLWTTKIPSEDYGPGPVDEVYGPVDLAQGSAGSGLFALGEAKTPEGRGFSLARLEADTGALLWATFLGDDMASTPFDEEPARAYPGPMGQRVFVARTLEDVSEGSTNRLMSRVDARSVSDGSLIWRAEFGLGESMEVIQSATVSRDGRMFAVATSDGTPESVVVVGLDAETGTELIRSQVSGGSGIDHLRALWPGPESFVGMLGNDLPVESGEATLVRFEPESLVAGPSEIILEDPADVIFLLDRPATSAGSSYWVLGSARGTEPGIPLQAGTLPLAPDTYFEATVTFANSGPFEQSLGILDAAGHALAKLAPKGPLPPSSAGLSLFHAFVEFDEAGVVTYASEAVEVALSAGPP